MTEAPKMIGKYKILGVVAKGGMGIVYRAYHPQLRRPVIIKKLTIKGNRAVLDRFKREAQLLLDLQNQYIVHMFDYFTEGASHYIVLEYVDGMALDKLLQKRKKLSCPLAMLIVRDACRALEYAHKKEVIHRDIKPGNILMSSRADVKLADFGIASQGDPAKESASQDTTLTQAGVTLGTPAYMPPEQFGDSKNVDARADIYAMGVMLYEMVTGIKPYPGNMAPETIMQIQKGKYIPAEKINEDIPKQVSFLIKKMMHPKPKKRFQSISQVLKLVERYLRRYEVEQLRMSLRSMMVSDAYKEPNFDPKYKWLGVICAVTFGALLICFSFFACWHEGVIHRYLLRPWFTPVSVTMALPQSAAADSDLPIRMFFFSSETEDIPEIENSRRIFEKVPAKKRELYGKGLSKNANLYMIKPVFLQPGNYRIKVVTGSYIWWQSLVVGRDEVYEKLDFLSRESRALKIHTSAKDVYSSKKIDKDTTFSVLLKKWEPLSSLKEGELKTGTVYRIKASAPGYMSEVFALRIEWYQDELYIDALLKPLP